MLRAYCLRTCASAETPVILDIERRLSFGRLFFGGGEAALHA